MEPELQSGAQPASWPRRSRRGPLALPSPHPTALETRSQAPAVSACRSALSAIDTRTSRFRREPALRISVMRRGCAPSSFKAMARFTRQETKSDRPKHTGRPWSLGCARFAPICRSRSCCIAREPLAGRRSIPSAASVARTVGSPRSRPRAARCALRRRSVSFSIRSATIRRRQARESSSCGRSPASWSKAVVIVATALSGAASGSSPLPPLPAQAPKARCAPSWRIYARPDHRGSLLAH